ncbi:MAG: glycosyltransferase, CESA-like subfamily [Deltaproteobacteria bacterium]|nr:glycosyltransferase, CESA-like subfamily [Deltaproteobacteria bacterium]
MFWIALCAVFYAYAGYPLVLAALVLCRRRRPSNIINLRWPKVSLLISAYNEETVIADKIENSLALDYPQELLEITVISDGSMDATDSIVTRYRNKNVTLKRYKGHLGKTACLNKAVPEAAGDIIVFSDANSQYDRKALKHLVEKFSDRRIGWVTGRTEYLSMTGEGKMSSAGIYTRIEQLTKGLEGEIGSCVGADGAIFAIRRALYRPLKDYDINDFVIPAKIIQQGYRGVLANEAFCIEKTAASATGEFKRHIRITTRTLRAIFTHRDLLNPFRYPVFSLELASHKLMKFIVPFALCVLFLANVCIVTNDTSAFYVSFLCLQIILFILWLAGSLGIPLSILARPSRIIQTFFVVNLAIVIGWIKFFQGEKFTTWATGR